MTTNRNSGTLFIIGGREDKGGEQAILREVAQHTRGGLLLVVTAATEFPWAAAELYQDAFGRVGQSHVALLDVRSREEAHDDGRVRMVRDAATVFFTGGDQWRMLERLHDTPLLAAICAHYERGGIVAGTSAGAAAASDTMIVGGPGAIAPRTGGARLADGLGLLPGTVIDSHFSERGRMGRLLAAVAQRPESLGIGIDEDTAILVGPRASHFSVIGGGGVSVVDARASRCSLPPQELGAASLHGLRLHQLAHGDRFDLGRRATIDDL
jgi:cyanophycinase